MNSESFKMKVEHFFGFFGTQGGAGPPFMEFAHSSQSFRGKTKQEHIKTMIFPTPVPLQCRGAVVALITALFQCWTDISSAKLLWVLSGWTNREWASREGRGGIRGVQSSYTPLSHRSEFLCVRVCTTVKNAQKRGDLRVAGLKSCAAVCRLVLCLQTHDTFTPLLKRAEGGGSDGSRWECNIKVLVSATTTKQWRWESNGLNSPLII